MDCWMVCLVGIGVVNRIWGRAWLANGVVSLGAAQDTGWFYGLGT